MVLMYCHEEKNIPVIIYSTYRKTSKDIHCIFIPNKHPQNAYGYTAEEQACQRKRYQSLHRVLRGLFKYFPVQC